MICMVLVDLSNVKNVNNTNPEEGKSYWQVPVIQKCWVTRTNDIIWGCGLVVCALALACWAVMLMQVNFESDSCFFKSCSSFLIPSLSVLFTVGMNRSG